MPTPDDQDQDRPTEPGATQGEPTLFLTTRWTLIADAASGDDTAAAHALGALAQSYWRPLYRYARRKGKSKEDAEDLVQGYLAHLLDAAPLGDIDRSRGRFRAFLLAGFNNWMVNAWKHATRQKRGGTSQPLSLDLEDAETGLKIDPADDRSPDRLFDREWALALLDKVLADLEADADNEGNTAQFQALKPCLTSAAERIPYTELAAGLDMSEGALRVAVHRLRKRYRTALESEVARTLADPDTVQDELHALFTALSS